MTPAAPANLRQPNAPPLPGRGEAAALALSALQALAEPDQDRARAARALRRLAQLGKGHRLQASLHDCLAGRSVIQAGARGFFLSDPVPCARIKTADQGLGPLCDAASTWFGTATPVLLIDIRASQAGASHCLHAIDGLGHIVLAGSCSPAEVQAALAHELAHCHFRCGNAFLDEGLAVHFETTQVQHHNFPAAACDMPALLSDCACLTPLRALLRWQPRGLSGLGTTAGLDTARAVYAQAWALVDHWMHTLGRAPTLAACMAIGSAPETWQDTVFAQATGRSIDDTHAALFSLQPKALGTATWPADQAADSDDCRGRQQRAQAMLQGLLARRSGISGDAELPAMLAEVDLLLAQDSAGATTSPKALLLLALRQTAGLLWQPDHPAALRQLRAAIDHYDAALAAAPDDPDVLFAAGHFFLSLPAGAGGRPAFGRHCLARADASPCRQSRPTTVNAATGISA